MYKLWQLTFWKAAIYGRQEATEGGKCLVQNCSYEPSTTPTSQMMLIY